MIVAEAAIIDPGQRLVRTVAITDSPGRIVAATLSSLSAIFTGILCTTFVKLPVALSGGSKANWEPLAGAISITLPSKTLPGYSSMRICVGSPIFTFVSCVSR